MASQVSTSKFLVHLRSSCGKSWQAQFGECLLDQLWHTLKNRKFDVIRHAPDEENSALYPAACCHCGVQLNKIQIESQINCDEKPQERTVKCHSLYLAQYVTFTMKHDHMLLSLAEDSSPEEHCVLLKVGLTIYYAEGTMLNGPLYLDLIESCFVTWKRTTLN